MNDPKGGIHQALIFMLGVSIIFLFAAYVFFFAAYMLVVRGIKLIIVMAVSSLAVACYIVPHHFEKYFTEWKDNLIHSALFAPILLIMLWAVIAIMDVMALRTSFQGIPAEGILKPEEGYFIASVLRYIVMAGLLMAAVKTAEKMAKQGNNLFGYSMWGAEGGIMTGKMLGVSPISGTRTLLRNRAASSLMSQREAADQEFKNAKTEDGRNAARKKLEKIQGRIDSGGLASGKIEKALGMLQKSMSGIKTKDTSVKDIIKKRDDEAKKKKENETADGKHLTTVGQAAVKESEHQDKDRQEAFKAHQEATDKLTGAISDLGNKIEEKNQKLKIDSDSVKAMQKDVDSYNAKIGPPTNTEKREMEQRVAEIAGKTKGIEKLRDEINADNAKLKSQNAQLLEHENRKEDRALQAIEDGKLRRKKEEEIRTAQKSGAVSRAWNVVNQIAPNMSQEGKEALHKRIMSTPEALAQQDREEKISTHLESITKKVDAVAEAPKAAAHTADAAHPPTTASSGGGHEPPAGAPKAH
jgi:general stress protein CsbA